MNTNRRQFLKTAFAGSLSMAVPFSIGGCSRNDAVLTLLHTNDVHSHIEPFPADHPYLANLGGFARRVTLINKLRAETKHLLLLDAGDIFQGTPYFNFFGGRLELELMSQMKYDAATIGNHEFDNGLEHLSRQMKHAAFPFVCTNYKFQDTILEGKTAPWLVFDKGPFRVGIIGLGIDPGGLVSPQNYGAMQWLHPVAVGEKTALMLKNERGCNVVIALSHLGLENRKGREESDVEVAAATSAIDIIIGGHSHTFLETPRMVKNRAGREVLINQMGWGGVRLGRIDLTLNGNRIHFGSTNYLVV